MADKKFYGSTYDIAVDILEKVKQGGGGGAKVSPITITENGVTTAPEGEAYSPVTVDVQPDLEAVNTTIATRGVTEINPSAGKDGMSKVTVDVTVPAPYTVPLEVTANDTYLPDPGVDGFDSVTVNVPPTVPVIKPIDITGNGTYNVPQGTDGFNPINVNVPGGVSGAMLDFSKIGYPVDDPYIVLINEDLAYSKSRYDAYTPGNHAWELFKNDKKLKIFPNIDLSKNDDFLSMCLGCENLSVFPSLKLNGRNFSSAFFGTAPLSMNLNINLDKEIPGIIDMGAIFFDVRAGSGDINVKLGKGEYNLDEAFQYCKCANINISASMPVEATGNHAFSQCHSKITIKNIKFNGDCTAIFLDSGIDSIDQIEMDKVTNIRDGFSNTKITTVGDILLPVVTDVSGLFKGCKQVTIIGNLDFPNATSAGGLFGEDTELQTVGNIHCPKATDISDMFHFTGQDNPLASLGEIDCTSVTSPLGDFFYYSWSGNNACKNLTDFGGFKNITVSFSCLRNCQELSHDSLMNVINKLGIPTEKRTMQIGSYNLAKLTPDEIAIATTKNWEVIA